METPEQKAASYGTISVILGVAPIPLTLLGFIPILGCLSTPLSLLAVIGAIGFGIAGITGASKAPERPPIAAWTGLFLGGAWVALLAVGVAFLVKSGVINDLMKMRGH